MSVHKIVYECTEQGELSYESGDQFKTITAFIALYAQPTDQRKNPYRFIDDVNQWSAGQNQHYKRKIFVAVELNQCNVCDGIKFIQTLHYLPQCLEQSKCPQNLSLIVSVLACRPMITKDTFLY